jgi:KUP system potassium uptake protein
LWVLRIPYVRDNRYRVTVFDHDRHRGSIIGVQLSFGFMEEPNVERAFARELPSGIG